MYRPNPARTGAVSAGQQQSRLLAAQQVTRSATLFSGAPSRQPGRPPQTATNLVSRMQQHGVVSPFGSAAIGA